MPEAGTGLEKLARITGSAEEVPSQHGGWGSYGHKCMPLREGEWEGEVEGTGQLRWRKDRDESKERDILIEGAIMGLARNLSLEKFSGIHKDDPS